MFGALKISKAREEEEGKCYVEPLHPPCCSPPPFTCCKRRRRGSSSSLPPTQSATLLLFSRQKRTRKNDQICAILLFFVCLFLFSRTTLHSNLPWTCFLIYLWGIDEYNYIQYLCLLMFTDRFLSLHLGEWCITFVCFGVEHYADLFVKIVLLRWNIMVYSVMVWHYRSTCDFILPVPLAIVYIIGSPYCKVLKN